MSAFQFATAGRIVFGPGTAAQAPAAAAEFGCRIFLVRGANANRVQWLKSALTEANLEVADYAVSGEPTIETIDEGVQLARNFNADVVVACGGGSVVDSGKAIAALTVNEGVALDYLEVIGKGQPLTVDPLPVIAVPTTSGTGAEVTRNAVLKSTKDGVKVSLRHRLMLPAVAIVDPDLTATLPQSIIASTGLDAFTQCLEPFLSCKATPITDLFSREGLKRAARSLRHVYDDATNADARADMAMASLYGGLALANAGLGAVHGFAGPLGGMTAAPHGLICARLLPICTRINLNALQSRAPQSPALARCHELGAILTGKPDATATDAIEWIEALCDHLQVPGLRQYGLTESLIPEAVAKSQRASSMKGNPIVLTDAELTDALSQAL